MACAFLFQRHGRCMHDPANDATVSLQQVDKVSYCGFPAYCTASPCFFFHSATLSLTIKSKAA